MPASNSPLRLYVPDTLTEADQVALSSKQSHYLLTVMRRKDGSPVLLFNGRDGEWQGHVTQTGKKSVVVDLEYQTRPQSEPSGPLLLFAPVKRTAMDVIAQKTTELGVSALWPVVTTHTNADRVNTERLAAIAVEAAEQSGRLSVPEVRDAKPLADVVTDWPDGKVLYVLDETGGGTPVVDALAGNCAQSPDSAAFVIGPEGGFAKPELDLLGALPFSKPVSLGPRILRADTAALAALTCWQALCGDWRG